ncbi:MAG: hypothetical protein WD059_01875 [Balneolaceae bacterium]
MSKQKTGINSSQAEQKLYTAYQSLASKKRSTVLLRSLFILLAGITAFIIAEDLFYFSSLTKTFLLLVIVALSTFSLWGGMKTITNQSFQEFYRIFSRSSNLPELKDTLDLEKSTSGNRKLIDAAIFQNLSKLEPAKLEKVLTDYVSQADISHQYQRTLLLSFLTLIIAGLTIFNFNHAFERSVTFWEAYEKPNPYVFEVKPGNVTIEQGSPFQVDVQFSGTQNPDDVSLKIKTSVEENYRTRGMNISGSTYQSLPFDLNDDLEYYIQMDEYKSDVFTADVQLRPRFSELFATVIPPAYTQLDTVQQSYPFSQIRAYEGSEIKLSGLLNKPVQFVEIESIDSTQKLAIFDDSTFSHQALITQRDTLAFSMADESGLTNKNSFQVILSPQKDEYPFVEILEPQNSFEKVNPKNINLLFRVSDDFQLTSSSLHFEHQRAYVDKPTTGSISLEKPENGALQSFSWNLEELRLKPQDVLSFWVEVQDNDEYRGYKTSRSSVLTLTVPSMVDYFEGLDEREDEVGTDLEDISDSFSEMQDQYDQFKEKLKENPEDAGYEQKRELEQVQQQQEDVQKKIDELNEKFNEIKNELSENSILSEETQKAYEELKKLMEEIDDPAYLEALEKMKDQLGQMSPEQLREAMENLEFNEELYQERLERTIELFKQLKLNSDLDKLARSFEDQARKEEELSEDDTSEEEKNQQQEQSLKENKKLKEKVDSLSKNTSKKNEKKINEFQKEAGEELEQLMKELQEQLEKEHQKEDGEGEQKGDNESGEKNKKQDNNQGQNHQQRYEQLAQKTKSLMEGMSQQQMQINIAGMQYALHSLLTISVEQENLSSLASATENRSQAYVSFARNQRNVEEIFGAISDSLFQLSSEIPQLSNKINQKKLEVEKQLRSSLEHMAERDQSRSSVASRQALGGINDISFMIANLLEQLQNSQNNGGGGGMSSEQMMEQLQQSGEQQQKLNQQMQDMINDIQGERLSQDQMERLEQMAREQNRIRKQLQQIQQGGEGGDKIGSQLERMIEDMEDTINDLRGGAADPLMIERQQNILSRMLEAENAMQERDEEERREGDAPGDFERSTPPELTLEELEKQIRNRLNDPDFTKYSSDYQRLIENYFELLKQLQDRESS